MQEAQTIEPSVIARDVFISHSSDDAEAARELRGILEGAGYSCWMAPDDIVGTDTWTEQILAAIKGSRAMIVLISSASNKSPHVSREVNLALGRSRAVLPLRIENVPPEGSLEYLLSLVQRLDAFPPPVAAHGDRILRRIQTIVTRPPSDPATPSQGDTAPLPPPTTPLPRRPKKEEPAEAPVPASIGIGSVVGGFTIESVIGAGGMATVYRARQAEPSRPVALKVIRADRAADPTYRKRFLTEKETLASLEHPSIVPIYAAGESNGVLYIAMRLVDGPDLQERIASQGRLGLRETIEILKPIADAVDYAHSMGIVHRDLKPSNIILDRAGRPYLTDFGLGKQVEGSSGLSAPGVAIGTLDYMAPEQFTGAADDQMARAIDIYALGCVAFACLAGRAPFVRDTPEQLMYAHTHEPAPLVGLVRPDVPAGIDEVIARALAKDPAARYGSARELVAALDAAATAPVAHEPAPPPPLPLPAPTPAPTPAPGVATAPNRTLLLGGGAVAALIVVLLGANLLFKPGASPGPTQAAVATATPRPAATSVTPTEPPLTTPPATPAPGSPAPTIDSAGFPNAAEAQLRDLQPVPLVDRTTCTRFTLESPDALATISCVGPPGESWQAVFTSFPDAASLDAAYVAWFDRVKVAETTTHCWDYVQSNSGWYFAGSETVIRGQLGCFPWTQGDYNGVQIVWTYDDVLILGYWLSTDYKTAETYYGNWVGGVNALVR